MLGTVAGGQPYTLSVAVGNRLDTPSANNGTYTIGLLDGGKAVAELGVPELADRTGSVEQRPGSSPARGRGRQEGLWVREGLFGVLHDQAHAVGIQIRTPPRRTNYE